VRLGKQYIGWGISALFVIGIAIQSLGTAHAEKYGYNQADCPTIVKQAIDTVSSECSKAGRNKLCYGNSTIQATFQPGVNNLTFQSPGDTVDVSQIKSFTLSGMDTAANTWGVAEMKIKADLPDTDPTQAVTMILFGNVQVTDASADANAAALTQTPEAMARQNQNATATTNAINQQATHQAATATKIAELEGTATAKAETPTSTGTIRAAQATQVAATATKLAAYENTATAAPIPQTPIPGAPSGPYSGLQAFYFQSSDTAPCEQAPHDGILIQSPQGSKQRVTLSIDGAAISLGSTVYITAQPSKFLTINALEGSAIVTAAGQSLTVYPGTAAQVPLDTNLHASGVPAATGNYSLDTIRAVPTQLLPNTSVIFAPGLPSGIVFTTWTQTQTVLSGPSNACFVFSIGSTSGSSQINVAFNDSTFWYGQGGFVLLRLPDGNYTTSLTVVSAGISTTVTYSLHVIDATHISGTITESQPLPCVWSIAMVPAAATPTAPH